MCSASLHGWPETTCRQEKVSPSSRHNVPKPHNLTSVRMPHLSSEHSGSWTEALYQHCVPWTQICFSFLLLLFLLPSSSNSTSQLENLFALFSFCFVSSRPHIRPLHSSATGVWEGFRTSQNFIGREFSGVLKMWGMCHPCVVQFEQGSQSLIHWFSAISHLIRL